MILSWAGGALHADFGAGSNRAASNTDTLRVIVREFLVGLTRQLQLTLHIINPMGTLAQRSRATGAPEAHTKHVMPLAAHRMEPRFGQEIQNGGVLAVEGVCLLEHGKPPRDVAYVQMDHAKVVPRSRMRGVRV